MATSTNIVMVKGVPYVEGTTVEPWKVYELLSDHSRTLTAALLGLSAGQVDAAEAYFVQSMEDIKEVWG